MLGTTRVTAQETMRYASDEDFCGIFVKDMDGLYRLSFLLTGEHSLAEECFVRGLEDSQKGTPVFKEWTHSWARRSIIRRAIQIIRPQTADNSRSQPPSAIGTSYAMTLPAKIAKIIDLPQFERFVFVISVLERYSSQECSLLLSCARGDVTAAQIWALRQIASAHERPAKLVSIDSDEQGLPHNHRIIPQRTQQA